ncbi:hypothetical protein NX059_009676 [Plenodomus lindquistii]|nr:hypothetical protein NX059_009676 [Plenodomus lindquistii]
MNYEPNTASLVNSIYALMQDVQTLETQHTLRRIQVTNLTQQCTYLYQRLNQPFNRNEVAALMASFPSEPTFEGVRRQYIGILQDLNTRIGALGGRAR